MRPKAKRQLQKMIDNIMNCKKYQFNSTKNIANNLKNPTGTTISPTSIRNCIHKTGFSGYIDHKKPFLTTDHMKNQQARV